MRWSIKTKTEKKDNELITYTTRTQYVTVGDIVGMGKSAAGAVKNLCKKMPGFINDLKSGGNQSGAATATMINNIAQPLNTLIQGMEIYQKVMGVVNMLTPIMKLVARATGVWCSPGNIADIAEIVVGTVQQILIGILTSIILRLKQWIWNFEFKIRDITTEASIIISDNLRKSSAKINKAAIGKLNTGALNYSAPAVTGSTIGYYDGSRPKTKFEMELDKLYEELTKKSLPKKPVKGVEEVIFDYINEKDTEKPKISDGWATVYIVPGSDKIRILAGTTNNKGIYYSDDLGHTWKETNVKTHNFCCFCKIPNGKDSDGKIKYRYLAGGAHYITTSDLSKTDSKQDWSVDSYSQYNKDYYHKDGQNITKFSKNEKSSNNKDYYIARTSGSCYDRKTVTDKAVGIYYSDDNGVTWQTTQLKDKYIGYMFEFQEKEGSKPTVVCCDYDYNGIYYSEDGDVWKRSKDLLDNSDINHGRWIQITDGENTDTKVYGNNKTIGIIFKGKKATAGVPIVTANMVVTTEFDITLEEQDSVKKLKEIILYIHRNYEDRLTTYTETFWDELIKDILDGNYTIENAKNGDRL